MALVLRNRSDLVYLPDHGFVGEEGALRVLSHITDKTRRLDVSHNLLGSDGTITLFAGLTTLRARWNSSTYGNGHVNGCNGDEADGILSENGVWGLKEINLGCNAISDEALDAVMGYAKKDLFLRKVLVQANNIELRHNLSSIINSLNQSRITDFSLTSNSSLLSSSISKLLSALDTPHLVHLHLSNCNLGPNLARQVAKFLGSRRARNLEYLELNGNSLGNQGIVQIVDVIEEKNFTILQLGLFANGSPANSSANEDGNTVAVDTPTFEEDRKRIEEETRQANYQVQKRLPFLLLRNRLLTRRVQQAASRMLAPARILLNGRPLSAEQTAKKVMSDFSQTTFNSSGPASASPPRGFPLLDLPREVIYQIVRHTSGDAYALTEAQFSRLVHEAEDTKSVGRMSRVMRARLSRIDGWNRIGGGRADREEILEGIREVRVGWMKRGCYERWEMNREAWEEAVHAAYDTADDINEAEKRLEAVSRSRG